MKRTIDVEWGAAEALPAKAPVAASTRLGLICDDQHAVICAGIPRAITPTSYDAFDSKRAQNLGKTAPFWSPEMLPSTVGRRCDVPGASSLPKN